MRTLHLLLGALLAVAVLSACEDGSPPSSDAGETPGDDGGESTIDDDGEVAGAEVVVDESRTCHNIQVPDDERTSNSTQVVPVAADAPEGTEVVLEYSAQREPVDRTGRGALEADGTGLVYVPLYSLGETLTLEGATVGGDVAAVAAGGEASFTVAPLTDPSTTCDVPPPGR